MAFVFDGLAKGRKDKTLTVVDDCTKASVQIVAGTSIPALHVRRTFDQIKAERGLPKLVRTDNGPGFALRHLPRASHCHRCHACACCPSRWRGRLALGASGCRPIEHHASCARSDVAVSRKEVIH
jgi:hypothetical protein